MVTFAINQFMPTVARIANAIRTAVDRPIYAERQE